PIFDGMELTQMIRQPGANSNPYVPIIMLTGHSEKKRVIAARDAGVTEFLAKPISAKGLYQRVLNVVANPRPFIRTKSYFGPDRRRNANLAAVSTFADHEVILPPNKLKKAVQKVKPGTKVEFDPVARAEAALAELAEDFTQWMESECVRLDQARNALKASGMNQGTRDALFLAIHDIKGQATTFGFPHVTPVAESL